MITNEEVGRGLAAARKSIGYTLKAVADEVGISEKTISAWENAHSQPTAKALLRLRKIYGFATIDELLECSVETPLGETLLIDERELVMAYRKLDDVHKKYMLNSANLLVDILVKND